MARMLADILSVTYLNKSKQPSEIFLNRVILDVKLILTQQISMMQIKQ
jgi:hypothetical protein